MVKDLDALPAGMSRACTICQHLKRSEIDRRLAAGEPGAPLAHDYGVSPSSLHRHRQNCLRLGSSNAIKKEAARGSAATALLPTKETLSAGYFELGDRIDEIVKQATQQGSLSVAISGLNSIRHTLDSLTGWPAMTGHPAPRSMSPCKPISRSTQPDRGAADPGVRSRAGA